MTQTITRELRKRFEGAGETPERAETLAGIALQVRGIQTPPSMDYVKYIKNNNSFYKIITDELPSVNRGKIFATVGKLLLDIEGLLKGLSGEEEVNTDMRTEARARGVSDVALKTHDRICRALGFEVMQLTPSACAVYEWVAEQEAKGQSIDKFAKWAKSPGRSQFIRMYRKDASNISIDWPQAFAETILITADDVA